MTLSASRTESRVSPSTRAALGFAAAIAAALFTTAARADLKLCNRMSYVIEAAIGIDSGSSTASRGWFKIDPAQCRVVVQGTLSADRLMLHARALPVYGSTPLQQNGQHNLCISPENFTIAAARQCRSGQTPAPFTEIKPTATSDGHLVAYLAEDSEYDDEQAKLAAIQRLLVIAGLDASPIDGVDGPKTQAALANFLKSRGLTSDIVNAPTFFDTMVKAVQTPGGSSIAWCNETSYPVMAAIATDDGKAVTSRGWYRIEPKKCLTPDVAGQPKRVLSFAEAIDGDGRAIKLSSGKMLNWGGTTLLCTRETKFEFTEQDNCTARGLAPTGFATIDPNAANKTIRLTAP